MSKFEERIAAIVRKSLAEGLRSTSKAIPPMNMTPEEDAAERQRRHEETLALERRLRREEEDRRQQDKQRADRLHRELKATLGI
jgi:hypothetical protein